MFTLTLPDDTYHQLAQLAATRQLAIDQLISELVERAGQPAAPAAPAVLSGDAWVRQLEAITQGILARAGRYPAGFTLDDSRDTMYQGRGE